MSAPVFFWILLIASTGGIGCSLTATRPVQEMSNAEVAIRAAKDLNADSLVPDLYRSSVDTYFKAKRDYHLKDFENARRYALRATRLAEEAEFEAYRLGGATPEASQKAIAPEGATPDAESAFQSDTGGAPPANMPTPDPAATPPDRPPGGHQNPNDKHDTPGPGGPPGPRTDAFNKPLPMGPPGAPPPQNFTTTFPQNATPQTGFLIPMNAGTPNGVSSDETPSIAPSQGVTYDDFRLTQDPSDKVSGEIPQFNPTAIPQLTENANNQGNIPELGANGIKQEEGIAPLKTQPVPDLNGKTPSNVGELPSTYNTDEH